MRALLALNHPCLRVSYSPVSVLSRGRSQRNMDCCQADLHIAGLALHPSLYAESAATDTGWRLPFPFAVACKGTRRGGAKLGTPGEFRALPWMLELVLLIGLPASARTASGSGGDLYAGAGQGQLAESAATTHVHSARLKTPGSEPGPQYESEPGSKPVPGDAPADPGPRARLSGSLHRHAVQAAMQKVADWQLTRVEGQDSQDWTFATLYIGMLAASDTLQDSRYSTYVRNVARHYDWTLGPRKAHADDQAIGQSYLWLYSRDHAAEEIAPLRKQFDEVLQIGDDAQHPVWWWCDALFMAPPVWAQLAAISGDRTYLDYMHREWAITSNVLWDPQEHLFFRDTSYFDKREKNGKKVFWSRGNGWVMGGLVRVLTFLPEDDPRRPFYVAQFREMAAKIRALQGADGLWRPGLLDAGDYPYPEVSGSSFFVYATAWGVRTGLLDGRTYLPVVAKGWKGLVAHIYASGRLGSIQPIGAAPGAYTPSSSYVFGVGAFLLAGSEIAELGR